MGIHSDETVFKRVILEIVRLHETKVLETLLVEIDLDKYGPNIVDNTVAFGTKEMLLMLLSHGLNFKTIPIIDYDG